MSARGTGLALAALALGALPRIAVAQANAPGAVAAYAGVEARGVNFASGLGVKSVSEFAIPFAVTWSASPRLAFDLGGRYASATRTDSLGSSSLAGLTDIQLRGVYQLVPDIAVFTVSANLPTGKARYTPDELLVAGAIASDLLPYPVANFSSGFNLTSGVALAVPVGGWALGLAGSYRLNGNFTPLADTSASYKAGGEFRLRVGADKILGQSRLSLGFTYSSFGEDQFASSPIFQSGRRYITQLSWAFPIGNVGLTVYAWDLYRAAGSQLISGGILTPKRNVFTAGAAGSVQIGPSVLRPVVEFRSFTLGTSQLAGAGGLLSLAARYEFPVGGRFTLLPSVGFDSGHENVLAADGNPSAQSVSLTGWRAGLMVRTHM